VRAHLVDVLKSVAGQSEQRVADAHFVFAHDVYRVGAQQLVVRQQRSGNGVLYGHSAIFGLALGDGVHHLLEALVFDGNNRPL